MSGGISFSPPVIPVLGVQNRGADKVVRVITEAVANVGEMAGQYLAPTGLTTDVNNATNIGGSNAITFIGTGTVAENALVAISAGVRQVTVPVTGVVTGEAYTVVASGAVPTGYALHDCYASANGTLKVNVTAPLLALGQNYSIPVKVFKLA
jgi:hypothetical protein